ncbi:hypothetical protein RFI_13543, partial [Reticulomyxa filosa]
FFFFLKKKKVSCVDILGRGSSHLYVSGENEQKNYLFVTGCYDGIVRIWNVASVASSTTDGRASKTERVHTSFRANLSPIKGVSNLFCWNGHYYFGTACKNGSVKVLRMALDLQTNSKIEEVADNTKEHRSSVECISAPNQSKVFATGSVDTNIKLWRVDHNENSSDTADIFDITVEEPENETGLPPSKRIKLMSNTKTQQTSNDQVLEMKTQSKKGTSSRMKSVSTLRGHREMITCLHWVNPYALYSASWDQSIRLWDTVKEIDVYTWQTSSAVTSLQYWTSQNVLISAHSNQKICIWDPRTNDVNAETLLSKSSRHTYRSHRLPISDIKCSEKENRPLFISSSFDGTIKFWDLRSNEPLYMLNKHSDKVLCLEWINDTIVSGGADHQFVSIKMFFFNFVLFELWTFENSPIYQFNFQM